MHSEAAFLPQGYGTVLASVALFWLLLGLPGFVVLKRWLPASLESGGLGAIALSYLASFVVLSPLSILGYALHLPFWVFSLAVAVALAVSVEWCVRRRAELGWSRPSWIALVCAALIAADMLIGLRAGSNFAGDGRYHVARVRALIDLGFNSWDPLVAGHRFDEVYHTNLYHALIAACAQLTGIEATAAWAFCWFWAKLACAGAVYQLAFTVLGERWLAWISAALFTLWMASNSILGYPNMVAPYWLLPLAFAFLVELCTGPARVWPVIGLAALAWVLPQVHALYYVFACLLVAPVLVVALVVARVRKEPRRELTWALLALALGAPWIGTTLWQRKHRVDPPPIARVHPAPVDADHLPWPSDFYAKRLVMRDRGFVKVGGGMKMLDPASLRPGSQSVQLVVLLAATVAFSRRRRHFAVLAGVAGITLAFLYVPPLCSALIKAAGAPWVVRRLTAVPTLLHLTLFPSALAVLLPAALSRKPLHAAWLIAALVHAYVNGVDEKESARADYLAEGLSGNALYGSLRGAAMRRALCLRNIPREAVVATALGETGLSVVCSAYPLALALVDPTHRVADMAQRRVDSMVLFNPNEDAAKRLAILRYYRVRHFWVRGYKNFLTLERAYRPWLVKVDQYAKDRVLTLDLKKKGSVSPRPKRSSR